MTIFRIGHGYDVHALADGLPLVIGGVQLEHTKGCVAHSDGDVLVHALCDALLGAAALGDIGKHFPDTSVEFKGVDSLRLLRRCIELLHEHGYSVSNVDMSLILERPKIRPSVDAMRERIAAAMGLEVDCVSIKATTAEKMGFAGREEGVEAHAIALIYKG